MLCVYLPHSDKSVSLSVLWKLSPSVPDAIIAFHEVQVYSNTDKLGGLGQRKERKRNKSELCQLKFKLINGKLLGQQSIFIIFCKMKLAFPKSVFTALSTTNIL